MRQNHTTIPWAPINPPGAYEGYVAFCKRQKERTEEILPRQQIRFVGTITAGYRKC